MSISHRQHHLCRFLGKSNIPLVVRYELPQPLYQVSESLTPAADSRIGFYLIHHGKQLSRGLPCLLRFRFALTLTQFAYACWRGDRVIPIRPGVSWRWPRFTMAARGIMRHGSVYAGCRSFATGL